MLVSGSSAATTVARSLYHDDRPTIVGRDDAAGPVSDQLTLRLGAPPDRRASLDLWFDGASRGNGRDGARAAIGGLVIDPETGEVLVEVSDAIGEETNNVAEYRALLATIEAAAAFPARTIRVHGDSALVVNQLLGRWKVKAAHLAPLLRAVKAAAARYERVEYVHVPRAENARADALANAALDRVDPAEQAGSGA